MPIIDDFNFVIIGCPKSIDINIIIIIDEKYPVNKIKINMDILLDKLTKLNIDTTKKLDINIIHIKNKKVIASKKGSIKTIQGIIYYTQSFHMPIEMQIEIDKPEDFLVSDRIKPTVNYIIQHLQYLLTSEQKEEYNIPYNSNEKEKIEFIIKNNIFNLIISNIDLLFLQYTIFRNLIKSIFYKISTMILIENNYYDNQEYYTKEGVAQLLENIYPNSSQNSLYFLFRGTLGIRNDQIFTLITNEFNEICNSYIECLDLDWLSGSINIIEKIPHLDYQMQELY